MSGVLYQHSFSHIDAMLDRNLKEITTIPITRLRGETTCSETTNGATVEMNMLI